MNADARLAALRRRIEQDGTGALLICDQANVAYLTGFERVFDDEPASAAVVTATAARVYTDGRYAEAARNASVGTEWNIEVPANLYAKIADDLVAEGIERLAAEASMPFGRFRYVSERFVGHIDPVDGWVEELRQVKEDAEIERIARAQEVTDACFSAMLEVISAGMTESSVALEIECWLRKHGSEGIAFSAIVASGPNSSLPHAKPGDRRLTAGDLVVLDFGARVEGYCADMTRTIAIGTVGERERELYDAVAAANEAGREAVRAGVPAWEVDAAARKVLADHGFGERFVHGLGHGVGLAVHELPTISTRGKKSLLAGAVVTIEPGAYIPGFGGVRIEDLVVVGEGGSTVLTRSPRNLIEV